ncbi:pleckstrin homology domain-containing family G member 5 isoform X2 [Sabethes cyaneus]|uniref:pleckstrin homology domain-containing family G member 5 isoform X2 n=1 Tax=Sabethes cyaneus TaxID=53552 RepID=UPI00237DD051|nr:pleckstrin homology domain-containing family G member 5 isoform X2 [Sabethes cyaneus]
MNRSKNKTQRKSGPKATKGKGGNLVPTESNQSGAKPFEPSQSKPTLRGNKNDKFKDVHAKVDSGRHSDPKQAATKKVEISEPPPKLERANSFSLTRKLSQIYNKLSGSRECLATPSEGAAQPYQFTRSLSLSSIQLKKNYRKSLNESNLSRVHEDAILEHTESNEETENHSPPTPIEPPKLERSNSILASFRRKLSFRSDKKPKLPAKWNTSLQNLRQEDFMVSYDDLSFVDYDQFNQYEAHLERKLSISQRDLSLTQPSITQRPPATEHPIVEAANPPVIRRRQKTDHDLRRKMLVRKSFDLDCNFDLDKNLYRNSIDDEKLKFLSKVNRKSFRWSADVERDVDALNLDSLDQLPVSGVKRASEEAAQSISAEKVIDVCDSGMIDEEESLKCENLKNKRYSVSVGYVSRSESLKRSRSWNDAVEYLLESKKPSEQLKSRSLTHLDKLEPHIAPQSSIPIDYHQLERCKLFLACLEDIQSHSILTDVDQNKLFSNIRDICESNLKFWTYFLYPMVKESAETKQPMSVCKFKDGFIKFSVIFHPYTKYCAEQSTCQYYCKELYQNNSLFMSYCAWCESQKMCNRLRLADILVRPMQRLTKYGLLLVAIKKHIVGEHESETIDEMIHSVEEFVAGVNTHLTNRQENERLKGINARIDSYEVVDSNNENLDKMVKHYSTMFDLCLPMLGTTEGRKLFLEGDLKYKDCLGKMDVHCFLLTDFLLVCKKNKHENLKIVRQPYMTDRLTVQIKEQTLYCCYLNELSLVVAAFTLHCSKAQSWYDSITKAKHIYSRLKLGTASDMRQYGTNISICSINNINSNMNINNDNLSIRKSPLNSSIGSRVSSLNNSHSGSVDLNESKPVSIDFEKANSLSSDDGANGTASAVQGKFPPGGQWKPKSTVTTMLTSSNSLTVQPFSALGQSMPNLNLSSIPNNNTLSVPGTSGSHSHSGMVLLSPSQRGISYPPPSPTRATLRRGFAFSSSIKNPPLIKTRNVASQQSFILSQQPSFNSATLGQHQQCLQTPSPGSSPNVPFIKRKNSFQSQSPSGSNQVQGQSAVFDPNSHETDAT